MAAISPTYNIKGNLKFPLEDQDQYRSKIQFQAVEVQPPQFELSSDFKPIDILKEISGSLTNFERGPSKEDTSTDNAYATKTAARLSGQVFKYIDGATCDLYLPISFQVGDRFNYETPNLNIAGGAVLGSLNEGSSVAGSIGQGIQQGFRSVSDFFGNVSNEQVARAAIVRGAQSSALGVALPDAVKSAISIAAQVTVNPNVRATFRGVGLREFAFQFKFIPKSKKEADSVKNIIAFFRHHAYPESIPYDAGLSVGYKFPELFKIKMMYEKFQTNARGIGRESQGRQFRPILGQMKMCYLRSINTTYNPQSAAFHVDGQPVETDLTLNFVEYRTIDRNDLKYDELEYDPDLIGVNGGGYSEVPLYDY